MIIVTRQYFTSLEQNQLTTSGHSPVLARTRIHVKSQHMYPLGSQGEHESVIVTLNVMFGVAACHFHFLVPVRHQIGTI